MRFGEDYRGGGEGAVSPKSIQEAMMDGKEGTTKYAKGAKREAKEDMMGE